MILRLLTIMLFALATTVQADPILEVGIHTQESENPLLHFVYGGHTWGLTSDDTFIEKVKGSGQMYVDRDTGIFYLVDTTGIRETSLAEGREVHDETHAGQAVLCYRYKAVTEIDIYYNDGRSDFGVAYAGPWTICTVSCPLIIDMDQNEFQLGGSTIQFDIDDNGVDEAIQWLAEGSQDVFLVHDINQNGLVDNGAELFGTGTTLVVTNEKAEDGFQALAQFDQNDDGVITSWDSIWDGLSLWNDANVNGQTDAGELTAIADSPLTSLPVQPRSNHRRDQYGNLLLLWEWAQGEEAHSRYKIADVTFKE